MSGVEPHLLQVAFDTFKEGTLCEDAQYIQNIQALVIQCRACQAKSELSEVAYICPICESLDIEVVDGEDMYLMQLELF